MTTRLQCDFCGRKEDLDPDINSNELATIIYPTEEGKYICEICIRNATETKDHN